MNTPATQIKPQGFKPQTGAPSVDLDNDNSIKNLKADGLDFQKQIDAFNKHSKFQVNGQDVDISPAVRSRLTRAINSGNDIQMQKAFAALEIELIGIAVKLGVYTDASILNKNFGFSGSPTLQQIIDGGFKDSDLDKVVFNASPGRNKWDREGERANKSAKSMLEAVERELASKGFIQNDLGTCPDQLGHVVGQLFGRVNEFNPPIVATPGISIMPGINQLDPAAKRDITIDLKTLPPEVQNLLRTHCKEFLTEGKIVGYKKVNDLLLALPSLLGITDIPVVEDCIKGCLDAAGLGGGGVGKAIGNAGNGGNSG